VIKFHNANTVPSLITGPYLNRLTKIWYGPRRDRGSEGKCERQCSGVASQGSAARRSKKNKVYTDSPAFLVKIGLAPLFPVGLEKDLGRADHTLPVKALEDRFVEPEAPELRGVEIFLDGLPAWERNRHQTRQGDSG